MLWFSQSIPNVFQNKIGTLVFLIQTDIVLCEVWIDSDEHLQRHRHHVRFVMTEMALGQISVRFSLVCIHQTRSYQKNGRAKLRKTQPKRLSFEYRGAMNIKKIYFYSSIVLREKTTKRSKEQASCLQDTKWARADLNFRTCWSSCRPSEMVP